MNLLFLFDIPPEPKPVAGVAGLILLAFVVLMLTTALVVGFVFLLRRLRRSKIVEPAPDARMAAQPSSPNQL